MNLWVNRLRQLAILAVALFFFSCEDETSFLGYKNPNSKFEGRYVEIPLSTSTFLLDSIRTSNLMFNGEFSRLLVGSYQDEAAEIGRVTCNAASEFFNTNPTKLPTEIFTPDAENKTDSITLNLQLDYYTYGSKVPGPITLRVYELTDSLQIRNRKMYNSYQTVAYDKSTLLGEETINVDPEKFLDSLTSTSPAPVTMKIRLDKDGGNFANRLWATARAHAESNDTTFTTYNLFKKQFKGIYIEASGSDQMVLGVSLAGSGVAMYYTYDGTLVQRTLTFSGTANYTNIQAKFNGTDIGMLPKYTDLVTAPGNRIVQGGTGVVTKINLDNFYTFASQDSTRDILLNSAQLVINDIVVGKDSVPPFMGVRWLSDDNKLVRVGATSGSQRQNFLYSGVQNYEYTYYDTNTFQFLGRAFIENNRSFVAYNDGGSPHALTYSPTDKRYSGFLTLLFLELYRKRNEPERYRNFVLFPVNSSVPALGAKSLNRAIFPGDKVVLKIFYTEPTIKKD